MSLPKFPREGLQVLRIIRAEVPRPKELPVHFGSCGLRWAKNPPHFSHNNTNCCPMGLHPKSVFPAPVASLAFAKGRCSMAGVVSFGYWWDSIKSHDAQAAVDFIWPEVTR